MTSNGGRVLLVFYTQYHVLLDRIVDTSDVIDFIYDTCVNT